MSYFLSQPYFVIPVFGICVFVFVYFLLDRILVYLYQKNKERCEVIFDLLEKMFVQVDETRIRLILFLMSFGLGGVIFLLLWPKIVAGLLVGAIVTALGWSFPKMAITQLWNKRCTRLTNQMVDGLTIMSNGIKSGLSVTQSMERVVENIQGPLSQEFGLVLNKIRLGLSVEDALNEFGERIPKQDVQMFVIAINILKETGGNLGETFSVMTSTIRDRQKVEKKIDAMTAQGVIQGVIITFAPFGLLMVLLLVSPEFVMPLFTRPLGWVLLFIMLCLQVIGGIIMKKIVTIKV